LKISRLFDSIPMTESSQKQRPRRWCNRVALLAFGAALGLGIAEIVPRLFLRALPSEFGGLERVFRGRAKWEQMMVPDSYLGYRPRPGLSMVYPSEGRDIRVRTIDHGLGEVGFRDIDTQPPFDLVALGDSFVFCDDVPAEGCWLRRLAESTGLSVGSLGVSGYSTLAEARVLERYGRRLQPSVVLVGVFQNDFRDNLMFHRWVQSGTDDFWAWRRKREGRVGLRGWLAKRLVTYRLVDAALRGRGQKSYSYRDNGLDLTFRLDRLWLVSDGAQVRQHREQGWRLMQEALLGMRATAAGMGAHLMVVAIPPKEEVYWEIFLQALPEAERADVERPQLLLREFSEANDLAFCDLTPALRARATKGEQVYLRVSGHWNDAGNEIAAQAAGDCLRAQGLLPQHGRGRGAGNVAAMPGGG
jgi:hypothetical protein